MLGSYARAGPPLLGYQVVCRRPACAWHRLALALTHDTPTCPHTHTPSSYAIELDVCYMTLCAADFPKGKHPLPA